MNQPRRYTELTFTPSVQAAQDRYGTREVADRMKANTLDDRQLSWREQDFVAQRDSFYMATIGETGWPYLQHRGGPAGFVEVLDPRTLAFADLGGNRQLISTGNLLHDDRAALFFMDYAQRRRLKLLVRAAVVDPGERPDLLARVTRRLDPREAARAERVFVLSVEAYDWNCPQHITQRVPLAEVEQREAALRARIAELEARLGAS
ncbi:MAG: pyridoxamine 5'-phosphate oxidase family protein [Planctomycetota bacterium]